ncbi:MAG: hypothetical protein PVI09_12485 [Anaerolineae bacterium]
MARRARSVTAHSIDPDRYRTYMVRLWRAAPGDPWRCQVNCLGTGQERRFAGLVELFEFLVADVTSAEGEIQRQEDRDAWTEGETSGL